jgi:hypothetical protein
MIGAARKSACGRVFFMPSGSVSISPAPAETIGWALDADHPELVRVKTADISNHNHLIAGLEGLPVYS